MIQVDFQVGYNPMAAQTEISTDLNSRSFNTLSSSVTSATGWSIYTCYTLYILNIYNVYVMYIHYIYLYYRMYIIAYTMYIPFIPYAFDIPSTLRHTIIKKRTEQSHLY
jgi:hypothetical protein